MDHRLKASIQWVLSLAPGGSRINDRLQRIRNTLPEFYLDGEIRIAREILDAYAKYATPSASARDLRSLEIGAGWDLIIPMALRAEGVGFPNCVDLHRHLDTVRVQQTISRLRRVLSPEKCATIADWPTTAKESAESILERLYGIRYKAPCDARHTSFGPDGFDLFLSHNVMEHVPPHDLAAIHRESLRILKPGAVAVHLIDLQDHWAYATLRRSVHGFLGNGPISWKLLNPPIHYQNRLRSKEHVLLARTAGFEVMEAIETPASREQLAALARPGAVQSGFAGIGTLEELGVTALRLILRKPSP